MNEFKRRAFANEGPALSADELARRYRANAGQAKREQAQRGAIAAEKSAAEAGGRKDQTWGNTQWSSSMRARKLKAARDAMDAIDAKFAEDEERMSMDPDKRYISLAPSRDLIEEEMAKDAIVGFEDSAEFEGLSPTYACPVAVPGDDEAVIFLYPSLEHAFQATKTRDPAVREAIAAAPRAREAKALGAKALAKASTAAKEAFKARSVETMAALLRDKFIRSRELTRQLLATGDRLLVHRPPTHDDVFWGKAAKGGRNELGKLLTQLRDDLAAAGRAGDGREYWRWVADRTSHFDRLTIEDTAFHITWRRSGSLDYAALEAVEEVVAVFCGKHPKCALQLDHASCSRAHAVLIRGKNNGVCVIDLGSAHGTWIHRQRAEPERLGAFEPHGLGVGEEVRFGESTRRYKVRLETRLSDRKQRDLFNRLADAEDEAAASGAANLTVRVSNVSFDAAEPDVVSLFADIRDAVLRCTLPRPPRPPNERPLNDDQGDLPPPRRHRGVALVQLKTPRDVISALSCDGDELLGRKVYITRADAEDLLMLPPPRHDPKRQRTHS